MPRENSHKVHVFVKDWGLSCKYEILDFNGFFLHVGFPQPWDVLEITNGPPDGAVRELRITQRNQISYRRILCMVLMALLLAVMLAQIPAENPKIDAAVSENSHEIMVLDVIFH